MSACESKTGKSDTEKENDSRIAKAKSFLNSAPDSSFQLYSEVLKDSSQLTELQLVEVLLGVAETRFALGGHDEALNEVKQIEADPFVVADTTLMLKVLVMKGNFYSRREQNEDARKAFEKGLRLATAINDARHIIRFRLGVATSLYGLNKFNSALTEFKKVLSEAEIQNDSDVLAVTYQNIALIYSYQKDASTTAIDYQRHALTFNRSGIHSDSYAEMLNNLGAYYGANDQVDSSLQCYLASERIYRKLKNPQGIIRSKFNQANAKLRQKKYKESEVEFLGLLQEVRKYKITTGEFYVLSSLSEVKEFQGKYREALMLLDSSLFHLIKNNMNRLGGQLMETRKQLIRDKLKLDTTNKEWSKQKYFETSFLTAADDSVLLSLKKAKATAKRENVKSTTPEQSYKDWIYPVLCISGLLVLLIIWMKYKSNSSIQSNKQVELITLKSDNYRGVLVGFLEEEFLWKDSDFTSLQLAEKLKLDPIAGDKISYDLFNKSLQELINEKRIEHACRIFDSSSQRIPSMDAVAKECGFENTSRFYKAFASITGMQPTEYLNSRNQP